MAFGLRYGVWNRLDAGYKYSLGAHAIDARFQFWGTPGTRASDPSGENLHADWAASIGAQYSHQSFELFDNIDIKLHGLTFIPMLSIEGRY